MGSSPGCIKERLYNWVSVLVSCVVDRGFKPWLHQRKTINWVSVLVSCVVDHGFKPWLGQKDYKIGLVCLSRVR
jgi:hypothetical protein